MQGRDREPAVAPAVAVLDHGERGRRPGGLLLGLQDPGFVGLADLGGDHVQDPPAQHPQRLRVVIRGMGEQHPLRLGHHTASTRSAGRASTASTITAAWSTSTTPAAKRPGPARAPHPAGPRAARAGGPRRG